MGGGRGGGLAEKTGLEQYGMTWVLPTSPQRELRPRLCTMKKGPNGYGFNLHSDKSKPGQFIRAVDPDSPAEASGLRAQDRIVEVMSCAVFARLYLPDLWCLGAALHHIWLG